MTESTPSIDLNKIAAESIARTIHDLAKVVGSHATIAKDELRARLGTAFTRYLDDQLKRRSRVKTVLYREAPQFLYEFYVPQDIRSDDEDAILDIDAPRLFAAARRVVITGTGGSGKSFLLRHLFIDTIRHTNHIPIIVELRAVNSNGLTLESILFDEIDLASLKLDSTVLYRSLRKGQFALLLDGLDEVVLEKRDAVSTAVQRLAKEFPELPIVITSRPDDRFVGWDSFQEFGVQPLTAAKVRTLISRLRYDEGTKLRFLSDIESRLWNTHQSFLSNPLLLTIMLLTYSHNASVPTRMHLFYSQVFETLWNRHDALKDGYKRAMESQIEKDEFIRILEGFAFKTYWDSTLSMSSEEVENALQFGIRLAQSKCDAPRCLQDLVKAICILNQDGLLYTFTHRSFQEYYAARFLLHATPEQRGRLSERLIAGARSDQVIPLMWEMDRLLVERELIIPELERLETAVAGLTGTERLISFLRLLSTSVRFELEAGTIRPWIRHSAPRTWLLSFTYRAYSLTEREEGPRKSPKERAQVLESLVGARLRDNEELLLVITDIDREMAAALDDLGLMPSHVIDELLDALKRLREEHEERGRSLDELLSPDAPG